MAAILHIQGHVVDPIGRGLRYICRKGFLRPEASSQPLPRSGNSFTPSVDRSNWDSDSP